MEFLEEKRYEPFIENGQWIAPVRSIFLFCRIWDRLNALTKRVKFPPEVVWVNGAPGSGKGTNTRNVMRALNISARPVVVSDLLNDEEFQRKIDQGLLVDDEEVTFLVFKTIMNESNNRSLIVDGYPRTPCQSECIQLLQLQLGKDAVHMVSVVLLVDERASIQRQLARGQEAKEHNAKVTSTGTGELVEVRKTDLDPEIARARYNTFYDRTHPALRMLKKFLECHEINAKGSFDEVRDSIYNTLRKK
jgi:adenylate kinase